MATWRPTEALLANLPAADPGRRPTAWRAAGRSRHGARRAVDPAPRPTSGNGCWRDTLFLQIALAVIPVVLAITLHEAAHGYAALALGDDTARDAGRLSLNPLNHIDRVGTILLPGFLLISQLLAVAQGLFHVRLGEAGTGSGLEVSRSPARHGDRRDRRSADEFLPGLAGALLLPAQTDSPTAASTISTGIAAAIVQGCS